MDFHVAVVKEAPTLAVHHLPCTIGYDGPSQVDSFFQISDYVPSHMRCGVTTTVKSLDAYSASTTLTGASSSAIAAASTPTAAAGTPRGASDTETKTASPETSCAVASGTTDERKHRILSATFRGRELTGRTLALPAGSRGYVLHEVFGRAPKRLSTPASSQIASAAGGGGFDDGGFDGGFDDCDGGFDDGDDGPAFDESFSGAPATNVRAGEELSTQRTLEVVAHFDAVTDWVREAMPTSTDHTARCLNWIAVARAMHGDE